jgi:hypothetical protein
VFNLYRFDGKPGLEKGDYIRALYVSCYFPFFGDDAAGIANSESASGKLISIFLR